MAWLHEMHCFFLCVCIYFFASACSAPQVQPGGKNKASLTDMRSLSGGERSFSTVCFVLSLWSITESPFRALDEFDVYMVYCYIPSSLSFHILGLCTVTLTVYTLLMQNANIYLVHEQLKGPLPFGAFRNALFMNADGMAVYTTHSDHNKSVKISYSCL